VLSKQGMPAPCFSILSTIVSHVLPLFALIWFDFILSSRIVYTVAFYVRLLVLSKQGMPAPCFSILSTIVSHVLPLFALIWFDFILSSCIVYTSSHWTQVPWFRREDDFRNIVLHLLFHLSNTRVSSLKIRRRDKGWVPLKHNGAPRFARRKRGTESKRKFGNAFCVWCFTVLTTVLAHNIVSLFDVRTNPYICR
jgi:hypothetical protein